MEPGTLFACPSSGGRHYGILPFVPAIRPDADSHVTFTREVSASLLVTKSALVSYRANGHLENVPQTAARPMPLDK